MKRLAFKMHLKQGQRSAYEKRHREIWPELTQLLKEAGISEYAIFFDEETHTLFAFQKVAGNASSQDLAAHKVVQQWWDSMADIMEVNPDNSPVSIPMEEVFFLE